MRLYWTFFYWISVIKMSRSVIPEVKCSTGTYIGLQVKTYTGVLYNAFKGIKFANVTERFQEAVPAEMTPSMLYNATAFGPVCFQTLLANPGEEDCLFLNVFTPDINANLPVMLFLHGGGFTIGGTHLYDPDYFMETRRVVVVTVAYRLGVFGFLYLNDPNYPANLGIRDQILGLKWVRDNIRQFGGDPNRITLNGQSSGAASINILMHSPLAKGLFVGGISESGTSCGGWSLQPRCTGLYKLKLLATNAGCQRFLPTASPSWTAKSLVRCLRALSSNQILKAVKRLPVWDKYVAFPPIVEASSIPNAVITVFPWLNSSSSTHLVPWITGTNSDEADVLVQQFYPKNILLNLGFKFFGTFIMSHILYFTYTSANPLLTSEMIKYHYFYDYITDFEGFVAEIISNAFFYYSNYQCLITSSSPSYSYYFNYLPAELRGKGKGVGHGGELPYLWKQENNIRLNGSKADMNMSKNLVDTWIDFAYNQIANFSNVTWEYYNAKKDNILIIDNNGARMSSNPKRKDNLYWRSLKTNMHPKIRNCNL